MSWVVQSELSIEAGAENTPHDTNAISAKPWPPSVMNAKLVNGVRALWINGVTFMVTGALGTSVAGTAPPT